MLLNTHYVLKLEKIILIYLPATVSHFSQTCHGP